MSFTVNMQPVLEDMLTFYRAKGNNRIRTIQDVVSLYGSLSNFFHIRDLLNDWHTATTTRCDVSWKP
jgi:hypothetical protein